MGHRLVGELGVEWPEGQDCPPGSREGWGWNEKWFRPLKIQCPCKSVFTHPSWADPPAVCMPLPGHILCGPFFNLSLSSSLSFVLFEPELTGTLGVTSPSSV